MIHTRDGQWFRVDSALTAYRTSRLGCCLLVLWTVVLMSYAHANSDNGLSFSEAIRVLAKEQSQAEDYVGLLNTVAREDVKKYGRGILLYADARAEFNGLIEQMKTDLRRGESLEASPEFVHVLQNAVNRRVAFTSYVFKEIVGAEPGQKGFVATVTALAPLLMEAGKTIWGEYRQVSNTRQQEILSQLEGLKWRSFHEIPGSQ